MSRTMPGPPEKYQLLGPTIVVWGGGAGYYYHPSLTDAKRLTDAEAAAEYWRAMFDAEHETPHGYERQHVLVRTWHRFAHLPHALEVEA